MDLEQLKCLQLSDIILRRKTQSERGFKSVESDVSIGRGGGGGGGGQLLVRQSSLKLWNEGVGLARPKERERFGGFANSLPNLSRWKSKNSPSEFRSRAVMNGVVRRTRRDYARGTSIKRERERGRKKKI